MILIIEWGMAANKPHFKFQMHFRESYLANLLLGANASYKFEASIRKNERLPIWQQCAAFCFG